MHRISRSALVPYPAERMFALVDDVESYPSFLPWCHDAQVHRRGPDEVEASLELRRGGISRTFRTRNILKPPVSIELRLVDGPFRRLAGEWRFQPLGADGSKVSLDLEFELESRLTDFILGAFFEDVCNSLVVAFTRRAHAVYGKSGHAGA